MNPEQRRAFLLEGTRTAKCATTRRDGRPHVVPVWFLLDGDAMVFITARDSVKGRAIRRDGRVAMCVDLEQPPYASRPCRAPRIRGQRHRDRLVVP